MFVFWLNEALEKRSNNQLLRRALIRMFGLKKKAIVQEWREYAVRKRDERRMKAVSSFFFISKVLKRTINALRLNAIQSKFSTEKSGP